MLPGPGMGAGMGPGMYNSNQGFPPGPGGFGSANYRGFWCYC